MVQMSDGSFLGHGMRMNKKISTYNILLYIYYIYIIYFTR